MRKNIVLLISLISFLPGSTLLAAEKERAAVLAFEARNCPKTTAKVVTDMISTKIFDAKIFTIVEREQIKQVFRELELQMTGCTDSACAVKVGRLLSANKIVVGSVYKVDRYIVVTKVVNVADNRVEGNYRAEALEESDLESAVSEIVDKVEYGFKTATYPSLGVSAGYRYAAGDLADLTMGGFGINLDFTLNNFISKNTLLRFTTGAYLFRGKNESVDSILGVPLFLSLGYTLSPFRSTKIVPSLGGGYYIYSMKYDPDNADVYGNYEYERETFYDPALSVRIEIEYALTSTLHLFLEPLYTIAFEKNSNPQTAGFNGGVKMFL